MRIISKIFYILSVCLVLALLLFFILSRGHIYPKNELEYGVTFSKQQAEALGLDWQASYIKILDELKVRKLRVSAYVDQVEAVKDIYDYNDLDWQVNEASKRDAEIILAVGGRLPRWPECHLPEWYKRLSKSEQRREMLVYIEKTILRYKDNKNIVAWQVENEPFLKYFGTCEPLDVSMLDEEISYVRSLDDRPIIVTDSGELSVWVPAAKRADIFGTTMYRDTYSQHLQRYIHYPITPAFFRFKRNLAHVFAQPKEWIVIELQGEPWAQKQFQDISAEERSKTMSPDKFRSMIEFSSQTGFQTFYLWGVEYWLWEKEKNGNSEIWEEARKLFE